MLGAMSSILNSSLEAGLILILFMLGLNNTGLKSYKKLLYLTIIGALISSVFTVYWIDFFGDREIFEGYLAFAASAAAIAFWFWIRFKLRADNTVTTYNTKLRSALIGLFIVVVSFLLIFGKTLEIVMFPSTILMMSSNLLNTEILLKIAGAIIGLLITVSFVFIFFRTEKRISKKMYLIFSASALLVVVFRQIIMGLQVLFATGILPLTTWAVTLIAPLINNYYPAFFYILIAFTITLWSLISNRLRKNPPDTSKVTNPAYRRKLLAGFNRERRWVGALGISLLSIVMILGNTAFANREVKIEPPTPVTADGGKIFLPVEQVNDGKLHRFSYTTSQNIETRFIVIKKGESLYGTGLDACDICGNAGYYQRGKEVICKNCDVVMNIPTIGFPGGCNPIPLKNRVEGQRLVISTGDLEAKQDVFKD